MPYVNDFTKEIPTLFGTRKRHVSDMGFPKIGYQTFKLLAYQRLHEMAERWQERYPGVDIILIEPEPDDELTVRDEHPQPHVADRRRPARLPLGHREAGRALRRVPRHRRPPRHPDLATRVRKVVEHYSAEREKTRAWRRILEQTTGTLLRQSAGES